MKAEDYAAAAMIQDGIAGLPGLWYACDGQGEATGHLLLLRHQTDHNSLTGHLVPTVALELRSADVVKWSKPIIEFYPCESSSNRPSLRALALSTVQVTAS